MALSIKRRTSFGSTEKRKASHLQDILRALLPIVKVELIEVEGNGVVSRRRNCDPAVRKTLMNDSALLRGIISVASRCIVFQLESFVTAMVRAKHYLHLVAVAKVNYIESSTASLRSFASNHDRLNYL